jgi:hypothetical protein
MANRATSQNDPLDRWLESCDPLRGTSLTTPEVGRALDEMAASIVAQSGGCVRERRRWRRMRPRSITMIATAVAFASTGAALASRLLGARTGRYPTSRADVRSGGSGEELNLAAPDGRRVALEVSAGIPYPDGLTSWRDWQIAVAVQESAPQPCPTGTPGMCPSLISTSALRGALAMSAVCAWTVTWRQSTVAGDRLAAARAARVIAQAPGWDAVTALQSASGSAVRVGPFGSLNRYMEAVRSGNRQQLDALLANDSSGRSCWTFDPSFVRAARDSTDPGSAYVNFLDRSHS